MEKGQAVLVTTQFRGVFFGQIKDSGKLPAEITISNARNCLYWAASVGGFLGLAAKGPDENCKIGVVVPEVTLYQITSVTPVTEGAAEKWAKA